MGKTFFLTDVFTDRAFAGNQLAVFPETSGLSQEHMQALAQEFNFSETAFVLPARTPGTDFHLRIFTPREELPMAGHPTLGTARVLQHLNLWTTSKLIFETGIGPLAVEAEAGGWLTMDQGLPQFGPVFEHGEKISPIVGLNKEDLGTLAEGQLVSCGVNLLLLPVKDQDTLNRCKLDEDFYHRARQDLHFQGLYLWTPGAEPGVYHTRMFAPNLGISEDPATGSAAGPLVCTLLRQGVQELDQGGLAVTIHQGEALGRPSLLKARCQWDQRFRRVQVSGQAVILGQGTWDIGV